MYVFGLGRKVRGLALGFPNTVRTGGVWGMCVGSDGVGGWIKPEMVGCCYVCVCYESELCVYMAGPEISILC